MPKILAIAMIAFRKRLLGLLDICPSHQSNSFKRSRSDSPVQTVVTTGYSLPLPESSAAGRDHHLNENKKTARWLLFIYLLRLEPFEIVVSDSM